MKRVADSVAMEGQHYAAMQRNIRCYTVREHYANHKVNGHICGLAWRPAIAALPLETARNAISESMNILYIQRAKMATIPELHRCC